MCNGTIENILNEFDVYLYFGSIASVGHESLTEIIEKKESLKKIAYFVPITVGGNPDAGFRIARAMGHYYPKGVKCFIPDVCKSAGTLITIGSSEIIISNKGELGPLDIQLQNKEELFETSSGLDIMQAIRVLQEAVQSSFTEYLIDLRQSGLGTKIAAHIASEMASNLVSPITSQIDPVRLGEHQRALSIATAYGFRLNEKFNNTTSSNIERLITAYPTHGFVIDRKEASKLFKHVSPPTYEESCLEVFIRNLIPNLKEVASKKDPIVIDLSEFISSSDREHLFGQDANKVQTTQTNEPTQNEEDNHGNTKKTNE